MKLVLACVLVVTACGASLDSNPDAPASAGSDAGSGSGSTIDATTPDSAAACPNARSVWLNFGGATLSHGSDDNSTQSLANWVASGQTLDVPPFHDGSPTRAADLATVTSMVQSQLSAFPFQVVAGATPPAAPYTEIVLGGSAGDPGFSGLPLAVAYQHCADEDKNDVGLVMDSTNLQQTANFTVAAIGYGIGLAGTDDPDDCMCGWTNSCDPNGAAACTFGSAISVDQSDEFDGASATCAHTTQDEVATFAVEFCAQ